MYNVEKVKEVIKLLVEDEGYLLKDIAFENERRSLIVTIDSDKPITATE